MAESCASCGLQPAYPNTEKTQRIHTLWSRGESNPRPNKAKAQFLHVYLVIDCRLKADHEQPTKQRSPVKFAPGVGPTVS